MSSPIETVRADQPVSEAAKLMVRKDIGSLLVIGENEGNAMITERDVVRAVAKGDSDAPISLYQSAPLVTVGEGSPLGEAAQLMMAKDIRRLIVTDEDGKISGIVNIRDLTNAVHESFLAIFETS